MAGARRPAPVSKPAMQITVVTGEMHLGAIAPSSRAMGGKNLQGNVRGSGRAARCDRSGEKVVEGPDVVATWSFVHRTLDGKHWQTIARECRTTTRLGDKRTEAHDCLLGFNRLCSTRTAAATVDASQRFVAPCLAPMGKTRTAPSLTLFVRARAREESPGHCSTDAIGVNDADRDAGSLPLCSMVRPQKLTSAFHCQWNGDRSCQAKVRSCFGSSYHPHA